MNQAIGIPLLLGPRPVTSLEEYFAGGGAKALRELSGLDHKYDDV